MRLEGHTLLSHTSGTMNPGAETFTINLQRDNPGQPWGFRLQGGKDFPTPLSVQMVNPGSVAEQYGIKAGDAVLQINNTPSDELGHEEAKQEIVRSGNQVTFILQRGVVKIWKPQVTSMADLKPSEMTMPGDDPAINYIQRTSLAANKQDALHIGSSHNRAARPFPGFGGASNQPSSTYGGPGTTYGAPPKPQPPSYPSPSAPSFGVVPAGEPTAKALTHAQYNTPINMYSGENISDTYSAHANILSKEMDNLAVSESQPSVSVPRGVSPTLLTVTPDQKLQSTNGTNRAARGVSPTLLAVVQDADSSNKTDEEKTYSNPFKQSRSFKMLEQNLNNAEVSQITGRPTGTRTVQAPTTKPPSERKEAQFMTCGACGMLCTGVFVRIKGIPMHPECFKCVKCGVGLKNKGYFHIEDKMYCEVHARQVAKPPGPDMVAVPVYR